MLILAQIYILEVGTLSRESLADSRPRCGRGEAAEERLGPESVQHKAEAGLGLCKMTPYSLGQPPPFDFFCSQNASF